MNKLPRVIIVGRTNVGKSTLFNRLSTDVKSITLDKAGVTRDFVKDTVCWKDRCFELIDTGGVSLKKTADTLDQKVFDLVLSLLASADILVFVCDGATGIVQEDLDIARVLHKLGKKIILAVNKSDRKDVVQRAYEFQKLGFEDEFLISAEHGLGIVPLVEAIITAIPTESHLPEETTERQCRIVLLGKPNVGKSSLLNILLKQERAIVAERAGTTREPISEKISFYQQDIKITDTPGVRRKRAVSETLETLMVKSTLRAVEDADIVLLLIDGNEGKIVDQELKLAFYAFEKLNKAVIVLINKSDLIDEEKRLDLDHSLEEYEYFLKKVPLLYISCKTGKNVGRILPLVQKVWKRYNQEFTSDDLTYLFQQSLFKKPLYHKTILLRLYRVKQVKKAPIVIILYVNVPEWYGVSQLGYLENRMRKEYDLKGVPISLIPRKKIE